MPSYSHAQYGNALIHSSSMSSWIILIPDSHALWMLKAMSSRIIWIPNSRNDLNLKLSPQIFQHSSRKESGSIHSSKHTKWARNQDLVTENPLPPANTTSSKWTDPRWIHCCSTSTSQTNDKFGTWKSRPQPHYQTTSYEHPIALLPEAHPPRWCGFP